jgi:hypothetical protein
MILINPDKPDHEPLLPGEFFWIKDTDLERITQPLPMGPTPYSTSMKRILCKVLKVFIRSSVEMRYLCMAIEDPKQIHFIVGHILADAYTVSVTHPELKVSASVITEASARINARSISPELHNCFTHEEALRVEASVQSLPLEERYGYLIPKR